MTVLGGLVAGPGPGQGCSGYLVEDGDTAVVLDLGSGTLPELRRHRDIRKIDSIVISHMHPDHMLDLLALWWGMAFNPEPLSQPIPLWLPPGGTTMLIAAAQSLANSEDAARIVEDIFMTQEYDPNAALTLGDLHITFAPTVHSVPCWAMRVSTGHSDLVYTADAGPASNLAPLARRARLLIAEATLPVSPDTWDANRGLSSAAEVAQLAVDAEVESLLITHLWAEHDPNAACRRAAERFTGPINVAHPGLSLDW